jgi:hypothetical protein
VQSYGGQISSLRQTKQLIEARTQDSVNQTRPKFGSAIVCFVYMSTNARIDFWVNFICAMLGLHNMLSVWNSTVYFFLKKMIKTTLSACCRVQLQQQSAAQASKPIRSPAHRNITRLPDPTKSSDSWTGPYSRPIPTRQRENISIHPRVAWSHLALAHLQLRPPASARLPREAGRKQIGEGKTLISFSPSGPHVLFPPASKP